MFRTYKVERVSTNHGTFDANDLFKEDLSDLNPRKPYICSYDGSTWLSPFCIVYCHHIYDHKEITRIYKEMTHTTDDYIFDHDDLLVVIANYFGTNKFYDMSFYC